jgi:hypothetical protein
MFDLETIWAAYGHGANVWFIIAGVISLVIGGWSLWTARAASAAAPSRESRLGAAFVLKGVMEITWGFRILPLALLAAAAVAVVVLIASGRRARTRGAAGQRAGG